MCTLMTVAPILHWFANKSHCPVGKLEQKNRDTSCSSTYLFTSLSYLIKGNSLYIPARSQKQNVFGWEQIRKCSFSTKAEEGDSCGTAVTLLKYFSSVTGRKDARTVPLFLHFLCSIVETVTCLYFPFILFVFSLYMGCFT